MVPLRRLSLGGGLFVALGLGISGLATVVMVMLTSRTLAPDQFAVFMTWWLTVTLLVTVFGVFEVYLARSWLAARAAGRGTTAVVAQLSGQLLILVLVVAAVTWALAAPLADALFDGDVRLVALIPAYGATWAVLALQRGVATGQVRFGFVGGQLATEGIVRAGLVALVVVSTEQPRATTVASAAVLAGVLALVGTGSLLRGWIARPAPLSKELALSPLLWLLLGSVGPVLIGNVVVPWLAWAMPSSPVTLSAFAGAMTLSRIPTQFVAAAFGPMMAALSRSADRGDWPGHAHLLARALRLAGGLGGLFVALTLLAGPFVLSLYVGPLYELPRWILGLLALASACVFFATIQQASLAARLQWTSIAWAWGVGTGVFVGVLLLPVGPLERASLAPALAAAAAIAVNAVRLRSLRPEDVMSAQR